MKRGIEFMSKLSISWKVFLLAFLLVESVILILGYTYYARSSELLVTSQKKYAEQMVKKSDEYLQTNLKYIQGFFLSIANDARIHSENSDTLKNWLGANLIYYIPNAQHLHLLELETDRSGRVLSSTSPYAWFLLENDEFLAQMASVQETDHLYWLGPYYSPVSELTVTAALRIAPAEQGSPSRLLLLDLNLSKLYSALFADKSSELQGSMLLLNLTNEPVYGSPPLVEYDVFARKYKFSSIPQQLFESGWTQKSWEGHWLIRSRNNPLSWQVLMIVNQQQLLMPLQNLNWFVWLLGLLSFLFALGISYTISVFISKPIVAISTLMNRMDLTRLDERIRLKRRDELGMLALHFNRMAQRISDLIAELKATEEQKKLSDFIAMQSQIRPHFLFNTLNTIGLEAQYGNNGKVRRLIASLTEQLQYILHSTPRPVTFREELQATERYIELMMARYEGAFELDMDIDPGTLGSLVPKFSLQPLIENAIFHGLVPAELPGTLFINTSRSGSEWEILIEDDGVGMANETLDSLLERLDMDGSAPAATSGSSRMSGIGLRNVHERFKLMFGAKYKLTIESEKSEGTRIRIRLPLEWDEAGAKL
ncbi:sensor histidine kinase [Paenibacillus thalictri]|uniref:histidine kinase n=1 Tax=Paenibacillus thalictri TaxID=2527873 RepID=A0A4Q9DLP4_9BACL|nr:sensor histidine kinase [Paenibacillus thalictri]TBL74665.1 HAMP domain-containing protein [Paenibacillus thalictri]